MKPRIRFYAERSFMKQAISIGIATEGEAGLNSASLVFAERAPGEAWNPTLDVSFDAAQELMDELWHAGIRPTEGSGSAGSLAATERHLADLQAMLKKAGRL